MNNPSKWLRKRGNLLAIDFKRVFQVSSSQRSIFVRSAISSGQVSQQQIDSAIAAIRADVTIDPASSIEIEDDLLASKIVEDGILTEYQAKQLKAGLTKLNLGPYVITDWLGQGGMGQVFVAVHQMMERTVAIKVLPQSKSTPVAIASFTREIQTQAKLDHPNLVRAYDAGHDGNVYFLVTEYVPGTDLRKFVRAHSRLSMQQAASVVMQAALGLEHAHQSGLIHRDVKPANLLVTEGGQVKVSDLGLAGFLHEGNNDPRAGKIVGTADYLSPEQITTPRNITPASDIYSLGCTLYYSVTGKVPFPGGSTRDKARRHCHETPWHPRQFNSELTDEFVDIIADMMEKDHSKRVPSAAEVVRRLEPWALEAVLPKQQLSRSPWLPPPLPTGEDDTSVDFDMHSSESRSDSGGAHSQDALATNAFGSSSSETNYPAPDIFPAEPPLTFTQQQSPPVWMWCVIVLLSMAVGSLLTLLFLRFSGG